MEEELAKFCAELIVLGAPTMMAKKMVKQILEKMFRLPVVLSR